jgi:hypothetical protein
MGMVLIIWDRLFGTFQKEIKSDPVRYGLTTQLAHPYHLTNIVFHEWKNIFDDLHRKIPLSLKIKYLIMPPGWSHDGRTKTARQLRRELLQTEKALLKDNSI